MRNTSLFTTATWVVILGGIITYLGCGAVWAYSTFQTKTEAQSIESRLIRIEDKLDRLIESK